MKKAEYWVDPELIGDEPFHRAWDTNDFTKKKKESRHVDYSNENVTKRRLVKDKEILESTLFYAKNYWAHWKNEAHRIEKENVQLRETIERYKGVKNELDTNSDVRGTAMQQHDRGNGVQNGEGLCSSPHSDQK